jgi:hypothetical protein
MKKLISAFLLVFIALLSFHCQKEISNVLPGTNNGGGGTAPVTATLQGNVVDETGQPAAGVAVKVGNKNTITDSKGYFRIVKATLDKSASLVTADKAGYFKAYRTFNATTGANHVMIKLVRKTLIGTIPATGGEVTLANGAIVALPANAVVKKTGGSYTGVVNVFASYIDPTASDIGQTVPGSFIADDANGKRVTLSSFGMMAVELESSAGEKLQIATGSTATLTTPIPVSLRSSAPATISLWYVDEQTGIWKEEGTAMKNGNNYIGQVKHFSFWNCDVSVNAITLSMTLHNEEGGPLVHVPVKISRTGGSYPSFAYGYTDSVGSVSGWVPNNESLLIEVMDPCRNVIYSRNVGPYTQNANLGVIVINNTGTSLVTITGQLRNCSGGIVTNGHAVVSYDNNARYVNVNSNGQFSLSFTRCTTSPATLDVTGVDNTNQQQGTVNNIALVMPVTNTGVINACGVSTAQYINYTFDGNNYMLSSNVSTDSLRGSTYVMNATPYRTILTGWSMTNNNNRIDLQFNHTTTTAGTYPVYTVSAQQVWTGIPVPPFNVIVTSFPPSVGGFYEGSFSGQFRDSTNTGPLHSVNGTFRLRRI